MFRFNYTEGISHESVLDVVAAVSMANPAKEELLAAYRQLFSFMDLTTLEGSDTRVKVSGLCRKAIDFGERGLPFPAAVCIYPPFVSLARGILNNTPIRVATTAASFPSGQMPLKIKLAEISYVLDEGADEVDVVISRGKFLEDDFNIVFDELSAMKELCRDNTLKVILETGELGSIDNIIKASEIAIRAGADFIKTSTGKISPAATPEAAAAMLMVIRNHNAKTGRKVGLKPAGGISEPGQALLYRTLVCDILGKDWLSPALFRIGASRLADKLEEKLK
jgi:deoxyribose-phosphate aldolase